MAADGLFDALENGTGVALRAQRYGFGGAMSIGRRPDLTRQRRSRGVSARSGHLAD
jgi:hypothetical protein